MIKRIISLVLSVMMIVSVFVLYGIYGEKDIPDVKEAYNLDGTGLVSPGFEIIETYDEWKSLLGNALSAKSACWQNPPEYSVDLMKVYKKAFFNDRVLLIYSENFSSQHLIKFVKSEVLDNELKIYVAYVSGMYQARMKASLILEISKEFLSDVNSINVEVLP